MVSLSPSPSQPLCLSTFFLCPHPPLSLTSSSNSPPRHVHSQRCLLPSLLWQSLHLKIWPLMDWKSWGRSNSHLKINVGPVIQKGSQPFLYVHACIYICVCVRACVCVSPVEDVLMSSLQRCPLHYQPLGIHWEEKEGRGLADWPMQGTYHSLSPMTRYPLNQGVSSFKIPHLLISMNMLFNVFEICLN